MLSIGKIGAGDGISYLINQVASADEARQRGERLNAYYARTGFPAGQWWGAGAEALGVTGEVTRDQMMNLFGLGADPTTGVQLGRKYPVYPDGRSQAVAGYDHTFSAPKSVSVLWALGDDATRDAVADAHRAAWQSAMRQLEADVAATRLGRAGVLQADVVGISAAAFEHWFSRAGDPQLHTHVAVSAKVQTPDGRWRALDGTALYAASRSLGERYTWALQTELRERLGVSFRERAGRDGRVQLPEVEGISDDLITAFSQRSAAIEARLVEAAAAWKQTYGRSPTPAKLAELAQIEALRDRPARTGESFHEHQEEWRQRAGAILDVLPDATAEAIQAATLNKAAAASAAPLTNKEAEKMAREALATLAEGAATWSGREMETAAATLLRRADRPYNEAELRTVRAAMEATGELVALAPPELDEAPASMARRDGSSPYTRRGEERWTSKSVLADEDVLAAAAAERGAPTLSTAALAPYMTALGADQADAVVLLATSGRRVDALVGPAGSGKTTTMRAFVEAWRDESGRPVRLLAATARAADELSQATGARAETLDHALTMWANGSGKPQAGELILVDEASMVATSKLRAVVEYAREAGAVVRLVGDPRQLAAVGPGGGMEMVAAAGEGAALSELHRFTEDWQASASLRLRAGDVSVIAEYDAHGAIRGGDRHEMLEAVYQAWTTATASGADAIMVASDNASVAILSERARGDRIAAGLVQAEGVTLRDGATAGVGDVVATRENEREIGLSRVDASGRAVAARGYVKNRDRWQIVAQHDDGALDVRHLRSGLAATLPAEYVAQHVELAYAMTTFGAQGATVDAVFALIRPNDTRQSAYVALSRGRDMNMAYIETSALADESAGLNRQQTPQEVLARVIETSPQASASAQMQSAWRSSESLTTLQNRFDAVREADLRVRAEAALRVTLPQADVAAVLSAPQWGETLKSLRHAEERGADGPAIIEGMTAQQLSGKFVDRQISLRRQIQMGNAAPPELAGGALAPIPATASPEVREHLDALAGRVEQRREALAAELTSGPEPAWAASLGPRPENKEAAKEWAQDAAIVGTWRELRGLDPTEKLDAIPDDGPAAQRAAAVAQAAEQNAAAPIKQRGPHI